MKGSMYLSEMVSENDFRTGILNLLNAPCGSGKTTLFLDRIAGALPDKNKMLYLIDTTVGNNYLVRQHEDTAKFCDPIWLSHVTQQNGFLFEKDKVVIMTYALFGWLVKDRPDFGSYFDFIICDEFHNCFDFSHIPRKEEDYNACRAAAERIRAIAAAGRAKVVAITATSAPVEKEYGAPIYSVPFDRNEIRRYETHRTVRYSDNAYWQNRIAGKGVIFTVHIEKMLEFQHFLGPRAIAIWSPNATSHPLSAEQQRVRDYIIENESMPDEYDYLILNRSMGTAITLRGQIDFIVANTQQRDWVEQVRGRYRGDLETLYVLDESVIPPIEVPPQFLGRKLNAAERAELAALLSESISSAPIAWYTMEKYITANGYLVRHGKSGKNNYRLIEK